MALGGFGRQGMGRHRVISVPEPSLVDWLSSNDALVMSSLVVVDDPNRSINGCLIYNFLM